MAEPRSRRARILKNLQRQLETITTANLYAHTVHKVTTHVRNWDETPAAETPCIYIVDETTNYLYNAGKLLEHEWFVALYGVMKQKSQLEMEEFIADIEECLNKNKTLGFPDSPGPVAYMKIKNIITDNQLFSEVEGSQLFKVIVEIKYTGCIDNPR
jgi:hypothetical protein